MIQVASGIVLEAVPQEVTRLQPVSIVTIPPSGEPLISRAVFQLNTKPGRKLVIGLIGDEFRKWFLSGEGLIEGEVEEYTLEYAELVQDSTDLEILEELGDEEKARLPMSTLHFLMQHFMIKDRVIYDDGKPNIFFIRDQHRELRVVRLFRFGGSGWGLCADPIDSDYRWSQGSRVFYPLT